jgi:predicted dehydrogenase
MAAIWSMKHQENDEMTKKRFAIVGASSRAVTMFATPIATTLSDTCELVALCDPSQVHMDFINQRLPQPIPTFKDFEKMVREVEFDTLIVVTQDTFHHEYIIKGLKAGKDVICEKPMTIDDEKCRAILRTEKQTGRKVIVTFNYRSAPPATLIRKIIADGVIGDVVTVNMHWPLDLIHGADYFRRWHRRRANTGGLQVHKSTHHFDLVNWWIQDEPVSVAAQGSLAFYGKKGPFRHKHCRGCPYHDKCQFYWDITTSEYGLKFYVAAEEETGYVRDGCVFDNEIDIEDNYSLMVNYKSGARLAYSLQAWSPWEGFRLEIQGKKGRLEYLEAHGPSAEWVEPRDGKIAVFLNDGSRRYMVPPKAVGGHGGGDERLLKIIFEQGHPDPLGSQAGTLDAARSILVGVAATRSMQNNGAWVRIPDLLKGR